MNREQVYAYLEQWDAEFNQQQTRRVKTRSIGGMPRRSGAQVMQHLEHVVGRTPQVLVRISGGGKGMARIRAHLDYISRHGQLALEDQDGERHLGKQDVTWLGYEWQTGGTPIAEQSAWREAVNIVLSMPAGTDALGLRRAACEFAAEEFAGHQYAMALHTSQDDPSRHAAAQPHMHLCVKLAGHDGRRLNPRKQDLRRWRDCFAQRLRDHGIEAAASSRLERFQVQPGKKQSKFHLQARGASQKIQETSGQQPMANERARAQQLMMRDRYLVLASQLANAERAEHRALGTAVTGLGQERGLNPDIVRPR